jgi:hypothetical protein
MTERASTATSTASLRPHGVAGGLTSGGERREGWVTKRELALHLHVALRWIEMQHHNGLPHVRRGGVVRYRISEVEGWLRGEPAERTG